MRIISQFRIFPVLPILISGIVLVFLSAIFPLSANAFPELSRHGYASCVACHVSPNGGGALTPYGRNLSRDLLSTWGTEREGEIFHGALPKKWMEELEGSKLRIGGDLRYVQTHRETNTVKAGQFFAMQAQVETIYDQDPWALAMTFGKIEDPRGTKQFKFVSPRYYAMARFLENGAVRLGRFNTAFGLNIADHTLSIRRPLGLGPEVDRDNLELSWLGERNQVFASFAKTNAGTSANDSEQSGVLRYDRILNERSRVGASFWQGDGGSDDTSPRFTRALLGVHTLVNISDKWFFTGEIDRQEKIAKRSSGDTRTQSQYAFGRIHYEPIQGLWPFLQIQHERGDFDLDSSQTDKYGAGFNFFPRPHFEFLGVWNRNIKQGAWSDEAYLLLHYYL